MRTLLTSSGCLSHGLDPKAPDQTRVPPSKTLSLASSSLASQARPPPNILGPQDWPLALRPSHGVLLSWESPPFSSLHPDTGHSRIKWLLIVLTSTSRRRGPGPARHRQGRRGPKGTQQQVKDPCTALPSHTPQLQGERVTPAEGGLGGAGGKCLINKQLKRTLGGPSF